MTVATTRSTFDESKVTATVDESKVTGESMPVAKNTVVLDKTGTHRRRGHPETRRARRVAALRQLGLKVHMFTGDNHRTAIAIAR